MEPFIGTGINEIGTDMESETNYGTMTRNEFCYENWDGNWYITCIED